MIRRLVALAGTGLGLLGIAAFIFVGIKIWHIKADVNRQARYLAAKAHSAADAADRAILFVRDVLSKAKDDLGRVRPGTTATAAVNPLLRITALQASRELLGSVERAQGAVLAASDAVVVADAALNVASEVEYFDELDRLFGFSPEHLKQSRSALVSISSELERASGILGDAPESLTADQLSAANAALIQANDLTNRLSEVVRRARQQVDKAKAEVDMWAARVSYAVTALATLGAVGQLFLLRYCVRKLVNLPA